MTEEQDDDLWPFDRGPSLPSPLEDPLGFVVGTVASLVRWLARIDFLLFVIFLGISVVAVWRFVTRGAVAEEMPLYLAVLLVPVLVGIVTLAKRLLKRRE